MLMVLLLREVVKFRDERQVHRAKGPGKGGHAAQHLLPFPECPEAHRRGPEHWGHLSFFVFLIEHWGKKIMKSSKFF